jgi:integral membrane protein (TIGR01906 family)
MPYFPKDEYGFTKEDRLRWAPFALSYLINSEDVSYLADLKFERGGALFNERELIHLADVKNVVQSSLRVWYGALILLALCALSARRGKWITDYVFALRRGGAWMIAFALALGAIVLAGIVASPDLFEGFFTVFHSLFFEGDSWIFLFSDTLIRLFPIRFWQDAFLFAALIALGGGLALRFGLNQKRP